MIYLGSIMFFRWERCRIDLFFWDKWLIYNRRRLREKRQMRE